MKNIKFILILLLSLYAWFVQAQTVDSVQITEAQDLVQSEISDSNKTNTKSVRITSARKTKGIKISSPKAVEHVNMTDSVLRKKHNPTLAGILSIIPGCGQIYNKKYWKLPIVYGALGITGYFVYDFAHQMTLYKNEFIYRRDGVVDKINPNFSIYTDENILALRSIYRRRMEIAVAVTAILYIINIFDAVVDAHLYYFDISDDLSLRVTPQIEHNRNMASKYHNSSFNYGVNLTLNFK